MKTKIFTSEEAKSLISEIFFNKTSKATKISKESALNAFMFGLGRIGQKAAKDVAVTESRVFPQTATGDYLEDAAKLFSSLERLDASASSTYLLIIADNNTTYPQATTTFTSNTGIEFELTEDLTVGTEGYAYAKVRSVDTGSKANVDANTITKVSPRPTGHIAVTNEFKATGGRDNESDEDLRRRIYEHPNIVSQKTDAFVAEVLREQNDDVLFIQNLGLDQDGILNLSVVLQNGQDLTTGELSSLLDSVQGYFTLTDENKIGNTIQIKFVNPTWYEVGGTTGVDFRLQIFDNFDVDQVRKNIQIAMSRYFDLRYWNDNKKVEWDDLLQIVKQVEGVKYVPDEFFNPGSDETVPDKQLPRIYRFVMRALDGSILSDNGGVLTPVFYPNN